MFAIFDVPPGAAELQEQLGTKFKFWYTDAHFGLTLFKEGRPNTGENWAERLACELALMLGLPHALYELARWGERRGVISPNFVPKAGRLILGNEMLVQILGAQVEEVERTYRARHHTLRLVLTLLRALSNKGLKVPQGFNPVAGIETPLDVFVGYLVFDAWIANQDRHDQNWGLVRDGRTSELFLAPTFDHGAAMARNLLDAERRERLDTKDRGRSLEVFCTKARSALYPMGADERTKAMGTFEVCEAAAEFAPGAARIWIDRLRAITPEQIDTAIDLLPEEAISSVSKEFTAKLLKINRVRLLAIPV